MSSARAEEVARRPVLAVYRRQLLPYSETFVLNQLQQLQRFQPLLLGRELLNELPLTDLKLELLSSRPGKPQWSYASHERPDMILAHFGPDGLDAYPIAVELGVPLAVILHGYDVNTRAAWWRAGHRGNRMRGYPRRLRMLARDPNVHFFAISQSNRRAAIALGVPADKVSVCYTGIDTTAFRPAGAVISQRAPRVLFVGRLIENKACDYLIRAMAEVQRVVAHAELRLLGQGALMPSLKQLAHELHVNATFYGAATAESVRQELRETRVLCLPSVAIANGESEGFGMVLLEAQASGVPVVGTRTGGIPEAFRDGETGLLAEPRDVASLANCLRRLLTDDELASRCSLAGPAYVAKSYDIGACTAALELQLMRLLRSPYRTDLRSRAARRLRMWRGWKFIP